MDSISQLLEHELKAKITTELTPHIASIRQTALERIDAVIAEIVEQKIKTVDFADGSIPFSKINTDSMRISKDSIIDANFDTGKGVEDMADSVQLTVMNDCVVAEQTLIARTVQTETLIAKDIARDQPWVADFKQEILDAVPVPSIPKDWSWDIAQIEAKIDVAVKRQSQLKELEVTGEVSLSDVLYTTPGNRRVGINTMEPSDALTVWDNEVEVVVGKHKSQEGYFGTRRRQDLNIGANNKIGLTVRSDGSVEINKLKLLERTIGSSNAIPGHAAKKGDLVLNDNPTVGSYLGWICLDGLKWAGFGKIE